MGNQNPSIAIPTKEPQNTAQILPAAVSAPASQQLLEKSIAAALSAIEIYNKPDFRYRDEIFTILIINAWELLFKAKILSDAGEDIQSVHVLKSGKPKLTRNGHPMTIEITGAMKKLSLDSTIGANLSMLIEIRDTAVHFYHTDSLSYVLYALGVAALKNYQKLVQQWFGRTLLEYNLYILPLAFAYRFKTLSVMECEKEPDIVAGLIKSVAKLQADTATGSEYYFICEIATEVRSAKTIVENEADITLSVSTDNPANAVVVFKTQRLIDRYPLSYAEVIDRVKKEIPKVKQGGIDAAIKSLKIKNNRDCADYNYRTKLLEEKARKTGQLPKGTPSIYNENAVRQIVESLGKS
jgi:hypothetical protein